MRTSFDQAGAVSGGTGRVDGELQSEIRRYCTLGTESYRGYRSPYCGDGLILFVGPGGDEVRGTSRKREDWLGEAWLVAKAEIDSRVGA